MAGTTTHYSLPTVESTDAIDGASQITALATATDDALYEIAQSAGETYTLPAATSETLGGVKIGDGVNVTDDGTISVTQSTYTLPAATASTIGGVKPGTGLTVSEDGTLSVDISAILTAATTWGDIAEHGFTYQNS